jgi:hypothetical protein
MVGISLSIRCAVVGHTEREAFKHDAILIPLLQVQRRAGHTKRPVAFRRIAVADHLALFALIGELCTRSSAPSTMKIGWNRSRLTPSGIIILEKHVCRVKAAWVGLRVLLALQVQLRHSTDLFRQLLYGRK